MDESVWQDAEIVWDYLLLNEHACSADLLLVLGSNDDRVAHFAAELSNHFDYGTVMFSGGIAHSHDLLVTTWPEPEAIHFYDEFKKMGGKARKVLVKQHAQNTGDNVTSCYDMLWAEHVPVPATIQIITKPYMQRRVRSTFEAQWPSTGNSFIVSAPQTSFHDYSNRAQSFEKIVNLVVGGLQRIIEYPSSGLQTRQRVPSRVLSAWARLVQKGYASHLTK